MPKETALLQMNDIVKIYPGVRALNNVTFTLYRGEIHSLCGENGAGKSTLIKILTGAEIRDGGDIFLDGIPIFPKTPMDAQKSGISTVYQEINLCPNLSVAENIFIGRQPRKRIGGIDWKKMNRLAETAMARLNIRMDVASMLGEYSVAIQQMIAIARAVDMNSKVLVLDEPTSSLDAKEVRQLFFTMRKLRNAGMGIIFISHFIDQIYEITDRVTILRNGNYIDSQLTKDLPRMNLISKMIGKDIAADVLHKGSEAGAEKSVFYSAKRLGKRGVIAPLDIQIKYGEVLGFAGLLGCGRTETARLIFGIDRADEAEVEINGKRVKILSPADAIRSGIGFCPEDRKTDGIIANLTVRENIILALQGRYGMFRRIPFAKQVEIANHYIELLSIATPGCEQLAGNLSGGNQQKVILARWLTINPDLLLLDEPTRGIDVGAKTEIMNIVVRLAKEGKAILFISSELDEVVRCSDRVLVFRDRSLTGELTGELDARRIMETIAHAGGEAPARSPAEEGLYG
ncbi:MAG: sugar ABC transporter ATP-binding protein [Spirochaetales bacterium]|jgi:simple sugar transport system ATP-binding protein|nr:sugar ABC transporter ATP-binding protein [Spirochaetales bacterium]